MNIAIKKRYREWCECHGWQEQVDGQLPDGTDFRIMKNRHGFHIAMGADLDRPPDRAVNDEEAAIEFMRKWRLSRGRSR